MRRTSFRPAASASVLLALLLSGTAALPLKAAETSSGMSVRQAWLRATPPGAKVAGGYVTLGNGGPDADRLIGASLDTARAGEVHTMSMNNGVMHMERLQDGLAIPAGATLTLKPGGDHLMFLDPAQPLREGQHVAGTLTFAKAGTVPVTFTVAGMAAKTPP